MYQMAVVGYQNLAQDFPMFAYESPSVKSSLMSLLQTYQWDFWLFQSTHWGSASK